MELEEALKKYISILKKEERPKFKLLKKEEFDSKIDKAFEILEKCELCERKCGINRHKTLGFCKVGDKMKISSTFEHWGEEPFLIPSFTIFFWSCTFSCQFCQNWTISQRVEPGKEISEKELAKVIDLHKRCKNVNFVGGDPTPQLPFILKTLRYVKSDIPVVWNSNFYMSKKSMNLLKGVVDVYLSDWKYWSDKCAKRLSKVDNYLEIVKRNHDLAFKDSELVIRHLILPNHFECCTKPIMDYVAKKYGKKVIMNLMDQYHPEYKAMEYSDISRPLKREELDNVITCAERLKLNFIY